MKSKNEEDSPAIIDTIVSEYPLEIHDRIRRALARAVAGTKFESAVLLEEYLRKTASEVYLAHLNPSFEAIINSISSSNDPEVEHRIRSEIYRAILSGYVANANDPKAVVETIARRAFWRYLRIHAKRPDTESLNPDSCACESTSERDTETSELIEIVYKVAEKLGPEYVEVLDEYRKGDTLRASAAKLGIAVGTYVTRYWKLVRECKKFMGEHVIDF